MSDFNGIVYLTEEQYLELKTVGTLTVGDITLTFDESTLYVTDDNTHERLTVVETDLSNAKPSIDFAETERQKSLNLFDISNIDRSLTNYVSIEQTDQQIVFTSTNAVSWFGYKIPVEIGKQYTISVANIYYTTEGLFIGNSDGRDEYNYGKLTRDVKTLTITANTDTLYIKGYTSYHTEGQTFTIDRLQIEEGTVATEYQAYNGAIVHEKQIADVEHIETIYDFYNGKTTINGTAYTSGIHKGIVVAYNFKSNKKYRLYMFLNGSTILMCETFLRPNNESTYFGVTQKLSNDNTIFMVGLFNNNQLIIDGSGYFSNTTGGITEIADASYVIVKIEEVSYGNSN